MEVQTQPTFNASNVGPGTEYTQLCVWPGTVLGDSSVAEFEEYFLDSLKTRIRFEVSITTLPTRLPDGTLEEGTGGREDILFWVHNEDMGRFAMPRLMAGIIWWEDAVKYNDPMGIYSDEILAKYQPAW